MADGPTPARHHAKRRILRNTSANALAQAVSMVSSFVFVPLLLGSFGVSAYGVMVLAASVTAFSAILDLGVGAVLVRVVAERYAVGDHTGVRRSERSATVFYAGIGLFVAALMLLLGRFCGSLFTLTADQADMMRRMLQIAAIAQLFFWPASAARNALAGLQRFDVASGVSILVSFADIAAVLFVILMHRGPVVLVALRAAETIVAAVLYILLFRRLARPATAPVAISLDEVQGMLKSGSSIFALTIAQLLTRQQADKLVLGIFLGPAAVGLYEIASKIMTLVYTVTGLATSAVLPVAAELNARSEHDAVRSLFLRGSKILVTLSAPIIVILIAIAQPFIAAWCGPEYSAAIPITQVLLLAMVFLPLYELGDQMLIAKDRFSAVVPAGLACAAINVALSVLFVRVFGAIGVALGTLCAMYVEFPWFARVLSHELDLPVRQWLHVVAWPLYPLLLVPMAMAYAGGQGRLGMSLLTLAMLGAVSLAAYWAIAAFAAYSPVERRDLISIVIGRREGASA